MIPNLQGSAEPKHVMLIGSAPFSFLHFRHTMVEKLRQDGYRVTAIVWDPSDGGLTELQGLCDRVISLEAPANKVSLSDGLAVLRLIFILHLQRPGVALLFAGKPNGLGGSLMRLMGLPYVCLMEGKGRGLNNPKSLVAKVNRWLYGFAFKGAKRLFVLNEHDHAWVQAQFAVSDRTLDRINGVGVQLDAFNKDASFPEKPTALFLGRLVEGKGLATFFEAIELFSTWNPEAKVCFKIYGVFGNGPDAWAPAALDAEVERLNTLGQISVAFGGAVQRDGVPDVIAQSSVMVLPSTVPEGLPTSLTEAAGGGRAMIASDVEGCADVTRADPGEPPHGIVVPAGDAQALAHALALILLNSGLAKQYGEQARRVAEARYSRDVSDAKLIEALTVS